jgi:hypothetical protein
MYIALNWEFDSALSKRRNFRGGGGLNLPKPHLDTPLTAYEPILLNVIKSTTLRWALGDEGVDGKIIFRWIFRK